MHALADLFQQFPQFFPAVPGRILPALRRVVRFSNSKWNGLAPKMLEQSGEPNSAPDDEPARRMFDLLLEKLRSRPDSSWRP